MNYFFNVLVVFILFFYAWYFNYTTWSLLQVQCNGGRVTFFFKDGWTKPISELPELDCGHRDCWCCGGGGCSYQNNRLTKRH